MNTEVGISLGMSISTSASPVYPNAKRGSVVPRSETGIYEPRTTDEQDEDGLLWWPCSFCEAWVLVDAFRLTRERCACGARRCHRNGNDGWTKDGVTWWFA